MILIATFIASALIGAGTGVLTYLVMEWRQQRHDRQAQQQRNQQMLADAFEVLFPHTQAYDQSIADVVGATGRGAFKCGPRVSGWTDEQEHWRQS